MPSTHQSVTISTSIENIWEKLSDFHNMPWASNVLPSVEKVGDTGGDEIGAKRVLNPAGGIGRVILINTHNEA